MTAWAWVKGGLFRIVLGLDGPEGPFRMAGLDAYISVKVLSFQHLHRKRRRCIPSAINAVGGFAKILSLGGGNVDECLWVAVDQGEPGALDVNHHAMTAAKGVENVGNLEFDLRDFAGLKWFGRLEAVSEFAAKNVAAH